MRRRFIAVLLLIILSAGSFTAGATDIQPSFIDAPDLLRPGKAERFRIFVGSQGLSSLSLEDAAGQVAAVILSDYQLTQGEHSFVWNGLNEDMEAIKPGQYQLRLDQAGEQVLKPITIGQVSPQITHFKLQGAQLQPGNQWWLTATVNMPGTLVVIFHLADQLIEIFHQEVQAGETQVHWDGMHEGKPIPTGQHTLSVLFLDQGNFPANQQHVLLEVTAPHPSDESRGEDQNPPADAVDEDPFNDDSSDDFSSMSPTDEGLLDEIPLEDVQIDEHAGETMPEHQDQAPGKALDPAVKYFVPTMEEVPEDQIGSDFWRLPAGKWDEEAIWKVMLQPITVLWGSNQRATYKLRATPDKSSKRENIVGEIHYESQGVHVIENRSDGWSLVEVYNSSYGPDNRTRRGYGNTDELIRGYIETSELKVIQPRDDYGLLIDKLKQRMYVFKDGKLFTELLISTGIPTKSQPWNETPSGEFLMVSRVGQFNAGNLVCRMAMRINGGALIHEVPYILNESSGYWDYSSQESQLGKKASHGCIRVQRLNNDDGINMDWLWNNIKHNTKVLIWDDDKRFHEYPEDSLQLFYNPQGGKFYHLDDRCRSIKDRYLPLKGSFTYLELDNPDYSKLTPCTTCKPPLRSSEIDIINRNNGF